MWFKLIYMKQCLALAGVIFVMGAGLPVKQPKAATSQSHITAPELTYARMNVPPTAMDGGFLDNICLSLDPPKEIHDPDPHRARLGFQNDLPPESFDKLQPRPGNTPKPGLTVADQKLNYELFDSEGFALKLNLAPAYPYPEALMPTRLDPGFGISIKF